MSTFDGSYPIRSSSEQLEAVTKLLEEGGGYFAMLFDAKRGEWTAALEWGREAEDSPMAGASAFGVDKVAAAALEAALKDAGR